MFTRCPQCMTAYALTADASAAADNVNAEPEHRPQQRYWLLAATGLILLTIANAAWTLREPLLQYPMISTLASKAGWSQLQVKSLLNTPERFQLVSQDMHTHPTRSGILVLSLTLVNLAQQLQPFPVLEITLLNAANQPVARRQFQPTSYLRTGTNTKKGLAMDLLMPVLLELADPGLQAVGFEIKFL